MIHATLILIFFHCPTPDSSFKEGGPSDKPSFLSDFAGLYLNQGKSLEPLRNKGFPAQEPKKNIIMWIEFLRIQGTGKEREPAVTLQKTIGIQAMQKITVLSITLIICAAFLFMLMLLDNAFSNGMTAFAGIGPIAGLLVIIAGILSCWQYSYNRLMPERDYRPFLGVIFGVLVSYLLFNKISFTEVSKIFQVSFSILEFSLRLFLLTSVYSMSQRVGEWIRER